MLFLCGSASDDAYELFYLFSLMEYDSGYELEVS